MNLSFLQDISTSYESFLGRVNKARKRRRLTSSFVLRVHLLSSPTRMARVVSSSLPSFTRPTSSSSVLPSFFFSPFSTSKSLSSLTQHPFLSSSSSLLLNLPFCVASGCVSLSSFSSLARLSSPNENPLKTLGGHLHIHSTFSRLLHMHSSSSSLSPYKEEKKKDRREKEKKAVKECSRSSQGSCDHLSSHKTDILLPVYYVTNLDEGRVAVEWILQHANCKASSSSLSGRWWDGFPSLRRLSEIHLTGDLYSLLYNPSQSSSASSSLSSSPSFGMPGVDYSDIFGEEDSEVSPSSSSLDGGAIGIYVPPSFSRRLSSSSSVSTSSPPLWLLFFISYFAEQLFCG